MLITIMRAYRLIPARVRQLWSLGTSTSHLALAELEARRVTGLAAWLMAARMAAPRTDGWSGPYE